MRLLHTSDWHLGHRFHGRMRLEEQGAFLHWLLEQIQAHTVEVLLVAGDIFDTTTPGSRAQALYYRFLHQLAGSSCRHVVIIGGNHDSPSLLEAPREILRQLNIHVLGMVDDQLDKEIVLLPGQATEAPELLVCAVPFLRDRDIRQAGAAETLEEKGRQLRQGIQDHFQQVCQQAEQIRQEYNPQMPLVVMGHLFVAGGQTQEGDGVRELSIGGLDRIDGSSFPAGIDYLALGHLHLPQKVAGNPTRRYSGAPFAMSFSEVGQKKEVLLIDCAGREITPTPLEVPCFQPLASIRGDLSPLLEKIEALKAEERPYWLELQYEGATVIANLREQLLEAVADSQVSILRIRNRRIFDHALQQSKESETLDELSVEEVFARCLEAHQIEPSQRQGLLQAFAEIKRAVAEEDM
ncbi:exonuclease SbcCD subunit D C-terminal domain-containing protein [Desulfobulbus rhabdoformis]|uniref:exonuclease SbcCD subunit D C-terminal domain-containing protein n=1 Tax=Desulfobulbus rhabdoformis TaxID=34032 RepID=UPI001963B01E|nr:exonuclease SbcCD subunit D C-terminal domain-containing protein [Desulfobulbus rhabdoformis]MBM9613064.1 exonuclease SbcCD subunit D C-terminal domain-containing protein [Desulfobulbus rhabdoformis]